MNFSDKHFWPPGGSKLPDTQATPHLQLFLFTSNMDQKNSLYYLLIKQTQIKKSKSAGLVIIELFGFIDVQRGNLRRKQVQIIREKEK